MATSWLEYFRYLRKIGKLKIRHLVFSVGSIGFMMIPSFRQRWRSWQHNVSASRSTLQPVSLFVPGSSDLDQRLLCRAAAAIVAEVAHKMQRDLSDDRFATQPIALPRRNDL